MEVYSSKDLQMHECFMCVDWRKRSESLAGKQLDRCSFRCIIHVEAGSNYRRELTGKIVRIFMRRYVFALPLLLATAVLWPAVPASADAAHKTTTIESGSGELSAVGGGATISGMDTCGNVQSKLDALAKEGKDGLYGCLSATGSTAAGDLARSAAAVAPLPTNACKGLEDGKWYANRKMQCLIAPSLKYTVWDTEGEPVGTAVFAVAQEIDLSVTSLTWSETDQVMLVSSTGLAKGLMVNWTTDCAGTCSAPVEEPWLSTPIADEQTLKSTYNLSDIPTTTYDYLDLAFDLSVAQPDATIMTSANWAGVEVRCDANVAIGNSSGCVIPGYTPTFDMSRLLYGSSTDMIAWAQANLSAHWGLKGSGQPLHRLQSSTNQQANRNTICPSAATRFPRDPAIPDDSCDEFPFAGTYESGALNGVDDGANCAQVTAINTANTGLLSADWATITPVGSYSSSAACVRGHIPASLNSDAGGAYGNFVKAARLADDDPFWLSVVS